MTSLLRQVQSRPAQFFVLWVAANLVGGFLVGYLESNGLQFMATIMLTGALVGSFQWSVLWLVDNRFRWWAVATTLGWIATMLLWAGTVSSLDLPRLWTSVVHGIVPTVGMSIPQALILNGTGRFTGIWLLASLLGGAAQGAFGIVAYDAFYSGLRTAGLDWAAYGITHGLGWAAYGVVTGFAWLLLARLVLLERSRPGKKFIR